MKKKYYLILFITIKSHQARMLLAKRLQNEREYLYLSPYIFIKGINISLYGSKIKAGYTVIRVRFHWRIHGEKRMHHIFAHNR